MSVRVTKHLLLLLVILAVTCATADAQVNRRIIQLSCVVIDSDSASGPVHGVHIIVQKAGRGTTSLRTGFFSMPVLVGDSVVISAVGFVKQHYIVPDYPSDFVTIVIEMIEDVTYLSEVTIMPFPTEEVFKQAVLALNV